MLITVDIFNGVTRRTWRTTTTEEVGEGCVGWQKWELLLRERKENSQKSVHLHEVPHAKRAKRMAIRNTKTAEMMLERSEVLSDSYQALGVLLHWDPNNDNQPSSTRLLTRADKQKSQY